MFPFVAVEGQEKVKKALYLNIINEKIGGVLISGEKGTAKSTLVRGLKDILIDKEIVELPLNTTEDNLIGTLDIEKTLKNGQKFFQTGILKKCDQNILYIDEVNLLGENIISNIIEVASIGENHIERDGISYTHSTNFIIVGTMNPEEGELKGQFLEKFGLYVKIEGIKQLTTRIKIIKDRLEYENNPEKFIKKYEKDTEIIRNKIRVAKENLKKIRISEQILHMATKIVEEAHTSGNRTEIILIETAKGIAALDGREYLNLEDLKEAAEYVLPHRIREIEQQQEPQIDSNLEQSKDEKQNTSENNQKDNSNIEEETKLENGKDEREIEEKLDKENEEDEQNFDIGKIFQVKEIVRKNILDNKQRKGIGKRCKTKTFSQKGKYIKSIKPKGKVKDLAFDATIRAAAPYQNIKNKECKLKIQIRDEHIREKVREHRTGTTILFVVDSSGSMGVKKRMEAVKGAIMSLLKDAYEKRDRVGMISFRKDRAEEILSITRSVDLAQKKLRSLSTGGKTPLAEGLSKGYTILNKEIKRDKEIIPIMIILSDGRANFSAIGEDPIKESLKVAYQIKNSIIKSIVVDTEEGFVKLGMAKKLAEALSCEYYKLESLKSEELIKIVKNRS
ncbi:magnesium chelatase subunit D family protein [uncultured Fusobacterium sp.]|uniref:magnesium chelatase subunit D family protein n=1 Tax=uncultured Fusobacterium sp. TaxID=159267 RepID=UPI0025FFD0E0|nr:magnesium chelatase subunit D family protein [uncultured Fusobacterium sp.]